jgi:hypothetical protein
MNTENKLNKISIMDFPKNIFIELPHDYRNLLFQLIFLESKTRNIKKSLKDNNLKENIFKWRKGHDGILSQYINLESLLYLFNKAKKTRDNIENRVSIVKKLFTNSDDRIKKNELLISLIKDARYILRGNNNLSKKLNINPRTLIHYILNHKIKKLPLIFVKDLIKFLENEVLCFSFTKDELENKIISYRAFHGKIINVKFKNERKIPIKVTPEFESILFHLFGDGHVKAIGSGEYTQLKEKGRINFLNKIYNNFGYFKISKKSFDNGRVIIPKAIISILCKHYNLNHKSFKWNIAEFPSNLSKNKEFKIAGLSAFIIDEGHVTNDRGIEIYSSNKKLLFKIRNIAMSLGLHCSELKSKKASGNTKKSFRFRIKKESSIELIRMIKELEIKYPFCGLAQKENIIKLGYQKKGVYMTKML